MDQETFKFVLTEADLLNSLQVLHLPKEGAAISSWDVSSAAAKVYGFFSTPSLLDAAFHPREMQAASGSRPGAEVELSPTPSGPPSPSSSPSPSPSVPTSTSLPRSVSMTRQGSKRETPHETVPMSNNGVDTMLHSLDKGLVKELYRSILATQNDVVTTALCKGVEEWVLQALGQTMGPTFIRQLSIMLYNPLLEDTDFSVLPDCLACLVVKCSKSIRALVVCQLFAKYTETEMQRLISIFQQFITISIYHQQHITEGLVAVTKLMGMLSDANEISAVVPFSDFYNDAINSEEFNIKEDFHTWKVAQTGSFSFCSYPYLYDPASKARLLQMDNELSQWNEMQGAIIRGLFSSSPFEDMSPYLVLEVRRGPQLVQDTLRQINHAKQSHTLKKALKVKFIGEDGVDEGGVQKEFFQLLVRELFNPDYGMFTYDEHTRLNWFRPSGLDLDVEFELVGILIGLAIYNNHILEFCFPLVLYKKLMGREPVFDDLKELHPDVHANLNKLLELEGTEVEALGLFFQVEFEADFGEIETADLVPGGGECAVTSQNREEYVLLYTQHLLVKSTRRQFSQFQKGFLRLCSGRVLSWFRPEELEQLVIGGQELDLHALEKHTQYDDGLTQSSMLVRWFWEVAHGLSDGGKKRFLRFVTGSDRVPIKGLGHMNPPFVISRMSGDVNRLPTAHTCFNHLLLPSYPSKEALQERLELAIDHAEGFGLI